MIFILIGKKYFKPKSENAYWIIVADGLSGSMRVILDFCFVISEYAANRKLGLINKMGD